MRRFMAPLAVVAAAWLGPVGALADHVPHDPRPNPNCAWQSGRSVDWDGDGQPDEMVAGASHSTSFPRQVVTKVWYPITGQDYLIISWLGSKDGPDDVTVVVQGDHRLFGANDQKQPNGDPEQKHNGAVYAHVDYDNVENGRVPEAEGGIGIYEADTLVMACASSADPEVVEAAVCLAGREVYRKTSEVCPTG